MRIRRTAFLAIALLSARPAAAGIELAGTTGANFLTVGPGASLVGMGGTGNAGYSDLSAMTWNPAALGMLQESQLMLTHMPLPNSTSQEWMAFGGRMGASPTRWALSGRYQGDGSFQAYDALGNLIGTFNSSSLALGVNAARPLDQHTTVGLGAKFVNENLGSTSGYGGTFDLGILYRTGSLSLGGAAQNIGGSMKYDSLAYSMPMNFGAGLALRSEKTGLSLSMDYNHPNAYYDDVRAGAEWMWKDHLALRAGYRHELDAPINDPMNSTSLGLGLGGHGMWLDYGFVSSADGSTQQRITLRLSPKDWGLNFGDNVQAPSGGSQASSSPAAAQTPAASPPAASAPSVVPSAAAASSAATAAPSATSSSASKPKTSGTSAIAPASAAIVPAAVPPAPSARAPQAGAAPASAAPSASAPDMTTLVPVTPPAIPAPKPVAASHVTSLPGVSAPAPQSQPSAAPQSTGDTASGDGSKPANGKGSAPATATAPAGASAPAPAAAPAIAPAAAATPAVVESAVRPDGKPVKIHVKKDETLESIAKRFGTTKAALMMENNLVSEKLHSGQELKIPNHQ